MQASKVGRWSLLKLDSSRNAKLIKETIGVTQSHSEKECIDQATLDPGLR